MTKMVVQAKLKPRQGGLEYTSVSLAQHSCTQLECIIAWLTFLTTLFNPIRDTK